MRHPAVVPSAFGSLLVRWNGLDAAGFAAWDFLPGMRFAELAAWWRDSGADRGAPHEGLDISRYRPGTGGRRRSPWVRVPDIYPGEVVSIVRDFGMSVFAAHDRPTTGEAPAAHGLRPCTPAPRTRRRTSAERRR
jgi:hypothetical protein